MQTKTRNLLACAVCTVLMLFPALSHAEDGSILIDPIKETIEASAGEQKTTTLQVQNSTTDAKTITIAFAQFTVDQSGVPAETQDDTDNPQNWFSANPAEFTIAAGGTQDVAVTVAVPETAAERGYYVMARISIAGADSNAGASSETKQEIQSLYSVVIGTPAEQLTIDSLLGVIDNNSTAALVLTLNNPGNVHTTASGKIDLIKDGVVAETYSVNSTNIFPGKSRDVTIQIDPLATAISDYTIKATLAYGKSNAILTFDGSWENASEIQTDTNTQVAKVKNSATVVAEENKSGSLIIYSILGAGLMLIAAGLVLSFKNKQA